jgi:hypothetical protein
MALPERSRRVQIGWVSRRALALLLVLAASSVLAGRSTQMLAVSATVSPTAVVGFEMSAAPLVITSADLDRGYVEIVMKSRMRVATGRSRSMRPAVVMDIEPRADVFRSVSMSSAAQGIAANVDRENGSAGQVSEFRYRFEFSKTAQAGPYANAISVTVEL